MMHHESALSKEVAEVEGRAAAVGDEQASAAGDERTLIERARAGDGAAP